MKIVRASAKVRLLLLASVIVFFVLLFGCITSQPNQPNTNKDTNDTDSSIFVLASEITTQAKWYEYNDNGVIIKFIAVKGSDGVIRTAFDACDVCYGKRKGYRQVGNLLVCNNCGNSYAIDSLGVENKKGGGCWPGYLPSELIGEQIVIQKEALKAGRYRFA